MNESVRASMIGGSAWASRIGIRGIQAAQSGVNEFAAWVSTEFGAIGGQTITYHSLPSDQLPSMGVAVNDDEVLIFCGGARSVRHGVNVIEGVVESFESGALRPINQRVGDYMVAAWESRLRFRDGPSICVMFGHSYGGVCVSSYADVISRQYPDVQFRVETYGSPRCCVPGRVQSRTNLRFTRNLHSQDVVSHVPYTSSEAPIAARITGDRLMRAFNACGHPGPARIFALDGTFSVGGNNSLQVSDTTLSIAAWVTYAQHLTHRAHELPTYVSLMDAFAARSHDGQMPRDDVPTTPPVLPPPSVPTVGENTDGVVPDVDDRLSQLAEEERRAKIEYASQIDRIHAVPVSDEGVHGVRYRGEVRVQASDRRSAKRLSKKLNQMRQILGPLTTDQRAQMLDALEGDLVGPLGD